MRTLISFGALFLSVGLLQLSNGAISPLDAIGGLEYGFTTSQIGLLGSAHFVGFFVGCWWAPRLMGSVGHSRAFAAFAACGAISACAHPLLVDPVFWALLRVMTGLCIAGCYTVVEAWLQGALTNENRGKVFGVYRTVDLAGSLCAQLMLLVLTPAHYISYNLIAILCCTCLFPIVITRAAQPVLPAAPRLRPFKTIQLSPLGTAGVVVAGVTAGSFRMVGPVYGQQVGLDAAGIAFFLAAFVLGGAVAQYPIGWLADRYDRRKVLIAISLFSVLASLGPIALSGDSRSAVYLAALIFGFITFPIYSLSSAHANDFVEPERAIELSASLIFLYGLGAIASPYTASLLMQWSGPSMLFVMIACAHIALAIFGLARLYSGRQSRIRAPYRYLPRTSFIVGRMMRRGKVDRKNGN